MESVVTTLFYFPSVSICAAMLQSNMCLLENHDHFQKGSFRNKCFIAGPNGKQLLSIPLEQGKHQQKPYREVRISYQQDWQINHWRSIKTAYGSAPFYDYYSDDIHQLITTKEPLLWNLNMRILDWLRGKLFDEKQIELTQSFIKNYDPIISDLRENPSPRKSSENIIELPPYEQVFTDRHGFMNDLSILDLLFCMGPEARIYLGSIPFT